MRIVGGLGLGLSFALAGCTSLPDVTLGVCGNGVVEAGEDCDSASSEGAACGQPDEAHACQLVCTSAACPDGWSCGLDAVCRRGAGFAPVADGPFRLDAQRVVAADVDGDGRADAVGSGAIGVSTLFGTALGTLDDRSDLLLNLTGPTGVGDLDGDRRADLVAPVDIGSIAFVGAAARKFDAIPFALAGVGSNQEPMRLGVARISDLFPITEVVILKASGMCLIQYCESPTAIVAPPAAMNLADLAPAAHGELDTFVLGSREEIVLSARGHDQVWVYDLEDVANGPGLADDERRVRLRQTLALPGPAMTEPRLFDYDKDGRLDLLIGVQGGPNLRVVFAKGNLVGTFNAAAFEPFFDGFRDTCGASAWPLAIADLTGDGNFEYVGERGVCVWILAFIPYAYPRAGSSLHSAVIADVNRDGKNDVVAAYDAAPALDVFLSDGTLVMNQSTIATDVAPRRLAVGDFDGNFIADVAMILPGVAAGDSDRIAVSFGSIDGVASPPTVMATFDAIEDFSASDLVLSPTTFDQTTDLLVISRQPTGERGGSVLLGDSSRTMLSPLPIGNSTALAAAVGDFLDSSVNADATILLGVPSEQAEPFESFQLVSLSRDGDTFTVTAATPVPPVDLALACSSFTVGDFDGDGLDEVFVVDAPPTAAQHRACARDPEVPAEGSDARIAFLDLAQGLTTGAAAGLRMPGGLTSADLDLDGFDDAVVPYRGDDLGGSGVRIYRGGTSGLALSGIPVDLGGMVNAVAAITLAPGQPPALIAVGDEVRIAEALPEGGYGAATAIADLRLEAPATSVAVGDVDGDGLEDLIVLAGDHAHVLRRQPAPKLGDEGR